MKQRWIGMLLIAALLTGGLTGCKGAEGGMVEKNGVGVTTAVKVAEKLVVPSNAEAEQFAQLAAAYSEETGVQLPVETLPAENYRARLQELVKSGDAPLLFLVHGEVERAAVADACAPLESLAVTAHLDDPALALSDGGHTYALPLRYETFGLLYNRAVLQQYFDLPSRATAYASMEEINSEAALRALAEDLDAHKAELGIEAVFSSAPLKEGETHTWHTQLFADAAALGQDAAGKRRSAKETADAALAQSDAFGSFLPFWFDHAVTRDAEADEAQARAEFASGRSAMMFSGDRTAASLFSAEGSRISEQDIGLLPLHLGAQSAQARGVTAGADLYLCMHADAAELQQKNAERFLNWLMTGENGRRRFVETFGAILPFDDQAGGELPEDPVLRETARQLDRTDVQRTYTDPDLVHDGVFGSLLRGTAAMLQSGARAWEDLKSELSDGMKDLFKE
ncbi:MAG: ABC transporter substrate-binding protein [Clostridia bacterium]|nr:ABC transporter substrate-binding protein [Clostridia bacterium]